ncbi:MAG: hypothetical protein A2X03_05695 [Bacteroidetes bacterium GWA2_40_15]|nr:MAG: hypothetical protein A2X03_05695 [Bacteroidetes bacterium GWA2_40_15]OFX89692.1 MAG: hypothetical protein A2X06_09575 [Bacteroidetes bacterium GWC2_40_22]HBH82249.1 hypothetical protein [Bacteroidales bacterium]HBQ84477.1 hypothetical protein [Bacteroidales bacterium]
MKKLSFFIIAVFLLTSPAFFQSVNAQKSEADKEKEYKIQMAIEQQKKAMSEQKKAEEEILKELKESQKEMEKSMKEINVSVEVPGIPGVPNAPDIHGFEMDDNMVRVFSRRGERSFSVDEPFMWSPAPGNIHTFTYGENTERTRWDFTKNVKESSFSREYGIDVEKTAKSVVMSVNGDCKSGEIRIKITMPNGKTYSEIVIDESGNLNWRKSFNITETENQDKTGEWKYKIDSKKATGFFKISLQTN